MGPDVVCCRRVWRYAPSSVAVVVFVIVATAAAVRKINDVKAIARVTHPPTGKKLLADG